MELWTGYDPIYRRAGRRRGYGVGTSPQTAWWMLAFHALGAVAHAVGLVLTLTQGRLSLRAALFVSRGVNTGTSTSVVLDRQVFFGEWVYMTWIVAYFFILSLGFHLVIALTLVVARACDDPWITRWYGWCLHWCIAPWRWAEYFGSASIMILLAQMLLGIREYHVVIALVTSMGVTITFGWLTEVHSSHLIEEDAPPVVRCGATLTRRWRPGSWRTRMQFHLLGYLPYALVWGTMFEGYAFNHREFEVLLPDWVQYSVVSTCAVFTMFGFVQLVNQVYPYGPSIYPACEATYVVLSFAAKANLGLVVLFQALADGALFDEILGTTTAAI